MDSSRNISSGSNDSSHYQQIPSTSEANQTRPPTMATNRFRGDPNPSTGIQVESSSGTSTSDDYSDSCSSSDCSSSSWSSESIPEWESHIDSLGELFYVQFSSNLLHSNPLDNPNANKERQSSQEERQEVSKKKKKSRLSRLLKRRAVSSGHKGVSRTDEILPSESPVYLPTEAHHSPADDWSDWTSFTLELEVHPATTGSDASSLSHTLNSNTGRRNKSPNLCETLLGFVPGVTQSVDWHGEVSLRQRVIVDKLVSGGPLHQGYAHVQQGDWLETLNGQNVTHRDLNDILSSINSREIVALNFRRRPPQDSRHQDSSEVEPLPPHGLFLLSQENVTETSSEAADILYQSSTSGCSSAITTGIDPLLKWRGAGVTLAHLMPQLIKGSSPTCSSVVFDGLVVNLVYQVEDSVLLLIAAPSTWCTSIELQMTAKQLSTLFQFQYGSIRRALTEPRWSDEIRRMVDTLFYALQQPKVHGKSSSGASPSASPATGDLTRPFNRLSSYFITCGQWLPLPPESHLDVTLTLNQMEAIDYEDWDEETISIQRCVTITGSAVFCQGYLVASTLTGKRMEAISTFLKWNQILEMSQRRRLSSLIIWREIFLSDCAGDRSFLAVVGSGHVLLVALLECGGVTQPWDSFPDTFLIEEMQFYLEELEYLDLETTCNRILNGPQNPVLVTNLIETVDKTPEMPAFCITPSSKPTLMNYLSLDFGTGVFIAPTLLSSGPKFTEQFQKTALTIHKLFQRTLKSKMDLQRPDWGGPWSDKSLVALQEVSVVFTVSESQSLSSPNGSKSPIKESYWVTGKLFTSPVHRELYICYQDGVSLDILDLAFHLAFGAVL